MKGIALRHARGEHGSKALLADGRPRLDHGGRSKASRGEAKRRIAEQPVVMARGIVLLGEQEVRRVRSPPRPARCAAADPGDRPERRPSEDEREVDETSRSGMIVPCETVGMLCRLPRIRRQPVGEDCGENVDDLQVAGAGEERIGEDERVLEEGPLPDARMAPPTSRWGASARRRPGRSGTSFQGGVDVRVDAADAMYARETKVLQSVSRPFEV